MIVINIVTIILVILIPPLIIGAGNKFNDNTVILMVLTGTTYN